MTRPATQTTWGVSVIVAGLTFSSLASAQVTPLERWQNANTALGKFYLGVSGGPSCNLGNGQCGLNKGTQIITYEHSGGDQEMAAPVADVTGTIWNLYADYSNTTFSMCIGVANNVRTLGAGLVIWDCQDQSQGPGQYWTATSAEELNAPYPGCFAFVNQNSSVNGATVVMSVQNGVVQNGSAVIQSSLCTPTNNACGNPSNAWHPDQFWCPLPVSPTGSDGSISLVGGSGWGTIPVAASTGDGYFEVTDSPVPQFNDYAGQYNAWRLSGDFDGNGAADLAALNSNQQSESWGTIPLALSNGGGTFTFTNGSAPDISELARTPNAIPYVGDFNGDFRSDIALIQWTYFFGQWTTVPIAFSNGDGTFTVTNQPIDSHFLSAALGGAIAVGDFNGDGMSDFAVGGGTQNQDSDDNIYVALSRGDGTFNVVYQVPANLSACPGFPRSPSQVGRFNRDMYDDLAVVGPDTQQCTALSNGDGTFHIVSSTVALNTNQEMWWDPVLAPNQYPPSTLMGSSGHSNPPMLGFEPSGLGDYDGDGCTDYVLFGFQANEIYTLHSQCDGTFVLWTFAAGSFVGWVGDSGWVPGTAHFYGDFNNDGKTDILLTGVSGWNTIPVAFSNGDGTFRITNASVPQFPSWSDSASYRSYGTFFGH